MRATYLVLLFAPLLVFATTAFAQAPIIEGGGVQNAASNIALTSIEPQVMITIKGQNLATSKASASGFPLPTTLGGATVTFTVPSEHSGTGGALSAPLFYASPTQINAQVPNGAGGTLVVTTAAGSSAPYTIPVPAGTYPAQITPLGIFTQNTTGCGQAVAYNIHPDGTLTLNTPQNSLDPEKDVGLTIFMTGLGGLDFKDRQDGAPWTYNPTDNLLPALASAGIQTAVNLGAPGLTGSSQALTLEYLGPAPDRVAIDQANVLGHWTGVPRGCKVPLSLAVLQPQSAYSYGTLPGAALDSTQLVDVSIQPGGGVCSEPSADGLGIITWQKTVVSAAEGASSTEAVTAQFIHSAGLGFAQPGPFPQPLPASDAQASFVIGPPPSPTPACNASLPNTLDAGTLTVSGPKFSPIPMTSSTQDGRLTYQATLQPGTLEGGAYQMTGSGGTQVGAFTTTANIPPPITITTNLQPGTVLLPVVSLGFGVPGSEGVSGEYPFQWTGGDDRSIVTVQLMVGGVQAEAAVYGGAGSTTIPDYVPCDAVNSVSVTECTLLPSGSVEVIITQTPLQAPSQPFLAPGLAWGGEGTWKYVWDFRGLTN